VILPSSLAEHEKLEKVLDFLATTKTTVYYQHSSGTKPKTQVLLGGKFTLSQPKQDRDVMGQDGWKLLGPAIPHT